MRLSRGIRNNNPFNIRLSSRNNWVGKVKSSDSKFEQFSDIVFGVRAGLILLKRYILKGYNTPAKIISRFAPSSENATFSYITYVCGNVLLPDSIILVASSEFFYIAHRICLIESRYNISIERLRVIYDLYC